MRYWRTTFKKMGNELFASHVRQWRSKQLMKTMTNQGIVEIPLNKLMASDKNVRKTRGQAIEDLAASIQAHGLLHNLVVSKASKDKYQVVVWKEPYFGRRGHNMLPKRHGQIMLPNSQRGDPSVAGCPWLGGGS